MIKTIYQLIWGMEPKGIEPPVENDSAVNTEKVLSVFETAFPNFQKENNISIREVLRNPRNNRAFGCVFGAFMGDSLGSYCQFELNISDYTMDKVMEMRGGGTFPIVAGQLTDDSQLGLHLGYGLANSYKSGIPLQEQRDQIIKNIAEQYVWWAEEGDPFDIGFTTRAACNKLYGLKKFSLPPSEFIEKAKAQLAMCNSDSESNGCLMRITPMVVFNASLADKQPQQVLDGFILDEVGLTHPNKTVQQACLEWVHLLSNIINRHSDTQLQAIYEQSLVKANKYPGLQEWVHEARQEAMMSAKSKMGWSRIAWTFGYNIFRKVLKQESHNRFTYQNNIRTVIQKGGDTDTNACIVGGLLGSILGLTNLPATYLEKMLLVDCQKSKTVRHSKYNPKNAFNIVWKLLPK